jgi:hypothetical protein
LPAGIWQASMEGDRGIDPVYDWTTWKEDMNYPGSTQLRIGKKPLEQYPWSLLRGASRMDREGLFRGRPPGRGRVDLPIEA